MASSVLMIRTTPRFCLSVAFALATINFLSSSFALAQIHSLDSTSFRHLYALTGLVAGTTATDDSSCRLPRSMIRGLSDLQAYSQASEVSLSIDVDGMALTECAATFSLANPKDASWALGNEYRARLSGLRTELQSWNQSVAGPQIIESDSDSTPTSSINGRRKSTNTLLSIVR